MEDANPAFAPLHHRTRLDAVSASADSEANSELYKSIVGSLMHAAQCTRPDVAFAVAALTIQLPTVRHAFGSRQATSSTRPMPSSSFQVQHPHGTASGSGASSSAPLIGYTDSDQATEPIEHRRVATSSRHMAAQSHGIPRGSHWSPCPPPRLHTSHARKPRERLDH